MNINTKSYTFAENIICNMKTRFVTMILMMAMSIAAIAQDNIAENGYVNSNAGIYDTENDAPESKFDVNSDGNVDVSDVTAVISEILK